jgi:hypothetical protein
MTPNGMAWPQGVIARYVTVGGATVDIHEEEEDYVARCTGCTAMWSNGKSDWKLQYQVRPWTQSHAEKCRALPQPDGGAR